MFALLSPRLWLALAIAAALAVSHGFVYTKGRAAVRAQWDAAKVEAKIQQQAADEAQRLREHAAALSYENRKAAQVVRYVTVTEEIHDAIQASGGWGAVPVPDLVRQSIATAGQALAASQPGGAVQLPAPGGAEQRPVGAGLRVGPGESSRLFGAP